MLYLLEQVGSAGRSSISIRVMLLSPETNPFPDCIAMKVNRFMSEGLVLNVLNDRDVLGGEICFVKER